jgi:hypothetical protein
MPFPREETTPPVTKIYLVAIELYPSLLIISRSFCRWNGTPLFTGAPTGQRLPETVRPSAKKADADIYIHIYYRNKTGETQV